MEGTYETLQHRDDAKLQELPNLPSYTPSETLQLNPVADNTDSFISNLQNELKKKET
jgi:hypothetical protein